MTKADLRKRMSVEEYREWIGFYSFEAKYADEKRKEVKRGR